LLFWIFFLPDCFYFFTIYCQIWAKIISNEFFQKFPIYFVDFDRNDLRWLLHLYKMRKFLVRALLTNLIFWFAQKFWNVILSFFLVLCFLFGFIKCFFIHGTLWGLEFFSIFLCFLSHEIFIFLFSFQAKVLDVKLLLWRMSV